MVAVALRTKASGENHTLESGDNPNFSGLHAYAREPSVRFAPLGAAIGGEADMPSRCKSEAIDPKQTERPCPIVRRRLAVSYWKVIMSVRLSVVAFGFKGSFAKFALPEFKTL